MTARVLIGFTFFLTLITLSKTNAQEQFLDPDVKSLLDSLEKRTIIIQRELPRLSELRNAEYYFKKRELDITIFLREYHQYVFDEELDKAKSLIETRLHAAEKRNDPYLINFYGSFNKKLTIEMGKQRTHYQVLFKKEKNFRQELYSFIDEGSEYSLLRAKRIIELAIKYADEQKLETILPYLKNYEKLTNTLLFDFYSVYDLKKLTSSESNFQRVFQPLIESDSLESIKKAGDLVDNCYTFSANSKCILDTGYFSMQKMVVKTSISEYNERKGNQLNLSNLEGQAIIVRFDTLNAEGIYKWHNKIIVIGTVKLTARFDNVKRGEAIINADRRLIEYIRVNKLAKIDNEVKMGNTFLIPYRLDEKKSDFQYNPSKAAHQYMICYTQIESKNFTKGISKFLPPMQFREELEAVH